MAQGMDYELFKRRIETKIGLDLNSYKEQQMRRRIQQLMQRYGKKTFTEFLYLLERDSVVLEHFTDYLTINTSHFFRDPLVYRTIETVILPELIKKGGRLKIWSAGCSLGAEPYSLALLVKELVPGIIRPILATDFDSNALARAREGKYLSGTLKEVPQRFLKRYFHEQDGYFYLDENIKSAVEFRQQNLLTDPFEKTFNLILCRNVFIYFTMETQQALVIGLTQSLKPGGYLIIGSSEMISMSEGLGLEKVQMSVYRKK